MEEVWPVRSERRFEHLEDRARPAPRWRRESHLEELECLDVEHFDDIEDMTELEVELAFQDPRDVGDASLTLQAPLDLPSAESGESNENPKNLSGSLQVQFSPRHT